MNILLTSVGRRSYLVKYFKEAIGSTGEVHVSNSSPITPAFLCADHSVVTPVIYNQDYIPFLLKYCTDNQISAIISLFDIDLPVLSTNKKIFEEVGIKVLVSDEEVIKICNDKWETYHFLIENGFNAPKTFLDLDHAIDAIKSREVDYPLMIKPRWGMGSIAIYEAENEEELKVFYTKSQRDILNTYLKYETRDQLEKGVLIQEKLQGQEYGVDVINNLEGEFCNSVVKRKLAMRSGETDCAETVDNHDLKKLGADLSQILGHIGNLDVDVFQCQDKAYILEINARFGGGYPFTQLSGVNLPLALVKWLNDESADISLLTEKMGVLGHKDIEIAMLDKQQA